MKKKIIFVDDEIRVLDGLRRMLRLYQDKWDMSFALTAKEALDMMSQTPCDVIVSDIRMPGMDGTELLKRVKADFPTTVRFVLSGQSDQETWIRAAGFAHQFLSKPCSAERLEESISQACRIREKLRNESLQKIISGISALPSPPKIYQKIVDKMQNPETSLQEVALVVEEDIAMSAKILQLINSAFFSLHTHVRSPAQAVMLLGMGTLRALVLHVHIFEHFESCKDKTLSVFIESLRAHSIAVSQGAYRIASRESDDKNLIQEAAIAGMFHDIGRLILAKYFPKPYSDILQGELHDEASLVSAEIKIIGASHAEIGAYLLALWGLPDSIVETATFHHCPSNSLNKGFSPLTAVHVSDYFQNTAKHASQENPGLLLDIDYLKHIGLQDKIDLWRGLSGKPLPDGMAEHRNS